MSIGLKRIQVHLCGFSSSQIWNIAWHDWCSLGRIDAQYSVPQVATGNDEDYKQCWCCFYGSTTDWIPLENWLCRGPGRWLNGRLTKAILPVGMGGPNNLDKAAAEDELKQQMQIWAHVRARCTTCGWNTYMDLEGGNQRLSSHTENVESQSIGIFVGMWYGRWCRRWKQGIDEQSMVCMVLCSNEYNKDCQCYHWWS